MIDQEIENSIEIVKNKIRFLKKNPSDYQEKEIQENKFLLQTLENMKVRQ